MQHAIRGLLGEMGRSAEEVEEYRSTFRDEEDGEESGPKVAAVRSELDRTLALVEQARSGDGRLSEEALDDVIRLLSETHRN